MSTVQRCIAPLLVLTLTAGTLTTVAQTKSKQSSAAKKTTSKYHRLPAHYGKLKLKDEQVKEIYSIRETYGKKIDAIQKELSELREEQADKTKDVLTRTQVTAYNKLVAAGSSSKSSKKKKTSSTSSKK